MLCAERAVSTICSLRLTAGLMGVCLMARYVEGRNLEEAVSLLLEEKDPRFCDKMYHACQVLLEHVLKVSLFSVLAARA